MAGRRSDARHRMVLAARQLLRQQGYHATALSDVLRVSAAPRGSVYFHFPEGKAQLAVEAAEHHAREQVDFIGRAARESASPGDLVRAYLHLARDNLVAADYHQGCALAPLVIEAPEEDRLDGVGTRVFSMIIESLSFHFTGFGMERAAARRLAHATVAGAEGALVTARALRSPAPFEAVLTALESQAAAPGGAAG